MIGGDESPLDCVDFNALEDYFKTKYDVVMDSKVKDLDFSAVQGSLQGVDAVLKVVPQVKDVFHNIGVRDSGWMRATYDGAINFNPAYYTRSGLLDMELLILPEGGNKKM